MSDIFCGKVSICGVDTTKLTVLKEKEELLKKYKAGDMSARDAIVNGNIILAIEYVMRNRNNIIKKWF